MNAGRTSSRCVEKLTFRGEFCILFWLDTSFAIKKIADELKIPVLCNIHNIELAKQFANKILGLQDGKKKFDDVTEKLTNDVLQDLYKFEVL